MKNIKAKAVLLLVVLLAMVALAAVQLWLDKKGREVVSKDASKISALGLEGDCSKTISELDNLKANDRDNVNSINLLSVRGRCYWIEQQHQKAIEDFAELKTIYAKANDNDGLKQAEDSITLIKSQMNALKTEKRKTESGLTPEAEQAIREDREL